MRYRTAAEFGRPDDERVVEHAAVFEILDERRDGAVHRRCLRVVVLPHVLVAVPVDPRAAERTAVEELNEPHAALKQPAGHQAIAGKTLVCRVVDAIERPHGRRLVGEARGLRDAHLHSRCQFIRSQPRREVGVAGVEPGEVAVHGLEEAEIGRAIGRGAASRSVEIGDRVAAVGAEGNSLMVGREEATGPVDRSAGRLAAGIGEDDERREVFVDRPQTVAQPGPHGGEAVERESAVHVEGGRRVVVALGDHRVDEAEIVGAACYMR